MFSASQKNVEWWIRFCRLLRLLNDFNHVLFTVGIPADPRNRSERTVGRCSNQPQRKHSIIHVERTVPYGICIGAYSILNNRKWFLKNFTNISRLPVEKSATEPSRREYAFTVQPMYNPNLTQRRSTDTQSRRGWLGIQYALQTAKAVRKTSNRGIVADDAVKPCVSCPCRFALSDVSRPFRRLLIEDANVFSEMFATALVVVQCRTNERSRR